MRAQELQKTKRIVLQQVKLLVNHMGATAKPRHRQVVEAKNIFSDPHQAVLEGQAMLTGMWGMLGSIQCLES